MTASNDIQIAAVYDEAGLARLAEVMALEVRPGDCIALVGDLGAGKTTFARAFIRAVLNDPSAEVPSPTFAIEQPYETPRFDISHYDLYRLGGADELAEIGFEERLRTAVTLVEWPDRAETLLPDDLFVLQLDAADTPDRRAVRLFGQGRAAKAAERVATLMRFLGAQSGWAAARVAHLQGDASSRSYARLIDWESSAILMNAPRQPNGPIIRDGKPYSRIAHLAEDVRPFAAMDAALRASGIAAPAILASDLDDGLILLEDFGDLSFGRALAADMSQAPMWHAAVDVLLALRAKPLPAVLPLPDGTTHTLPRFDRAALEIELGLIFDWFWPAVHGAPAPVAVRAEYDALWSPLLDGMLAEPAGLFLRDYHSPNLFWRPEQTGIGRVGVIDFQDALAEPWAYDLAALLQDARVDVPAELEREAFRRYCGVVAAREPDFDPNAFAATYAVFGAQRNTRLVGLWVRLLKRDGKPNYLQHMPRTWDYLARNLAHPRLASLKAFYDRNFPQEVRTRCIGA